MHELKSTKSSDVTERDGCDFGREIVIEHESGVDMAFDALMDLEENADLPNFMRSHLETVDTLQTDKKYT